MLTLPRELEACPFRHKADHYWVQLDGLGELERLRFIRRVCAPPFRSEVDASPAWKLLLTHIDVERVPGACSLELEHAFRRPSRVRALTAGVAALAEAFPECLHSWLRWVPYRFCKNARILGSLAPERVQDCVRKCKQHPLFTPIRLPLDPNELARTLLDTWSPLPPPAKIVDCLDRELSEEQASSLLDALERWLPLVRLDLIHHHCRKG